MTVDLPQIEDSVASGRVVVWGLGGPSVVIWTGETVLYIDLFVGPSPRPDLAKLTPDIDPAILPRADAVLCTHVHNDHCHERSLRYLHEHSDTLFLAPKSCCDRMCEWGFSPPRIVELAPGQQFSVKDVSVNAVPTNDFSDPHAIGFVLEAQGVTLYDGGDCMYFSGFRDIGRRWEIDGALINYAGNPAPDWNPFMEPQEVVQAAKELQARRVLLKHWDLWASMRADPGPMIGMLAEAGIDAVAFGLGSEMAFEGTAS